ncbi:MAG: arginine--tRNA ligase [Polyangia bacterium]
MSHPGPAPSSLPVSLLDLSGQLGRLAAAALRERFPDAVAVPAELALSPAARPEFGDLQITGCLQLAKPLGQKPRDLATLVHARLAGHPAVVKAEIAGPGYVNLTLSTAFIEGCLASLPSDPHHGIRQAHAGQRLVIDFSSPNIAKPMHIGHIRSTIIGDALQRVLRAVGYAVTADNHLGDWGTQFGKLIVAYRSWLDRGAYERDPIGELVRLYQRFVNEEKAQAEALGAAKAPPPPPTADDAAAEATTDDSDDEDSTAVTPLLKAARAELAKLQQGDAENLALWREFVTVSLREFDKTYARLGVRFDTVHGESYYHDRLAALVEELLEKGVAEPSRGAVVCPVEGAPAPLLIRKADGSFLYGTTDIATIEYRVKTYDPSRILYVVGVPQQLHFQQLFAVARKLGVRCELEHIMFGSMRFRGSDGNWTTGSTRKGNVPLLDEFIDEAVRRARSVAAEKNPELSAADLDEVARIVGVGAIKYNDLSRDRLADMNFDLDKALSLEGNTAPYMQYAYARLRSIARKAAAPGEGEGSFAAAALSLREPAERALGRKLLDYPGVVEQVARTTRPHQLCEYLYELAGAVSVFYNEVPVLKAPPAERGARLLLLDRVAQTLKHGLGLLGIEVPERM